MIRPTKGPLLLPRDLERPARDSYELVILGAGCSGLSLCYYLLEEGVDAPILVLDRKRTFEDDRTWCFWDVEPTPFTHLSLKEWRSWSFASEGGRVTQTTNRYPYKFVAARDFYEHALARLAKSPNVTCSMGRAPALWRRGGWRALVWFARDAALLTVAALVLLLGLYLVVPEVGATPPALLALYLLLVSALTLPHVVVVSFMDVRQGLWRDSRQLSAISHQQKSSS